MSSFFAKALTLGALAAPALAYPGHYRKNRHHRASLASTATTAATATIATTSATIATTSATIATTSAIVATTSTTSALIVTTSATTATTSATTAASSSATTSTAVAKVATGSSQAATDLCGTSDYLILSNTPWIVYNMWYNSAQSEGTQCTRYDSQTTAADGNAEVVWSSETDIEYVESTNNVPKGYAFVGLTANLETTITGIDSIPTTYDWTRTNSTAFKGNVCYDFMTSDTKGDSTSSSAHELMLWLQYEGGQLPIGYTDGVVTTIDNLFGTSWDLYEGKNTDTGITVTSMLPTTQFDGTFSGDLKDWLEALVNHGTFTDSTYVNVGNAGTEYFYGTSTLNATLGLQINLA